jgi:hypothetical protein
MAIMKENNKVLQFSMFFGIGLLMMSIVLMFINPSPESNLAEGFYTPIIAFEFIQNTAQVKAFFEIEQQELYLQKMLLGNQLDYIFMFLYSIFLGLFSYYLYKKTKHKIFIIAIILCPIAFLTDALENLQIYYIIKNLNADIHVFLQDLHLYTWVKWLSLAIVFLLVGYYNYKNKKYIFMIINVLPILLAMLAYNSYGLVNELFALSIVINFVIVFISVIIEYRNANQHRIKL